MLVIAKQIGEHPQGRWRNPGEKFEYDVRDDEGKQLKPAAWMMTADEAGKAKAEDRAKADEYAEIAKAQLEAGDKARADIAARKDGGDKDNNSPDKPEEFYSKHRGAGKHDVFGSDGEVVKDGSGLNKADAGALVELLLADKAEA